MPFVVNFDFSHDDYKPEPRKVNDHKKTYSLQYRRLHRDEINEKRYLMYRVYAEQFRMYGREKLWCDACSKYITRGGFPNHKKTNVHSKNAANQETVGH